MSNSIDDLKNVLGKIKRGSDGIIYTQHYSQKLNHRLIADDSVENLLLFDNPIEVQRLFEYLDYFVLSFKLDGTNNISVVVKLFNSDSLILITAVMGDDYGVF